MESMWDIKQRGEDAGDDTGGDTGEDMSEDICTRGLIGATRGGCPCNDNEEVEEDSKGGESDDDRCDGGVNLPKVPGEGTAKEEQRSLQHQR